jgi:methionine-rich copper-binding protein CopC
MTRTARLPGWVCLSLLLCSHVPANAQHAHDAGPSLLGVTSPKDDSVLATAPPVVVLSFRSDVRLLKLRLLSASRHNIDIGFAYDPARVKNNFVWKLPPLPKSSYFILAWAVADDTEQLVDGELRFAVGPDALPPSEFIKRYGLYVDHLYFDQEAPSPAGQVGEQQAP